MPVAPGEGERRAQRGYVSQYGKAGAAIYAALDCDNLIWVGLADRAAGNADDVVLGLSDRVVGHQFKFEKHPDKFKLPTLLLGAQNQLALLADAWTRLRKASPGVAVEIRFVTNNYPAADDHLVDGTGASSAAFLEQLAGHGGRSLSDWRSTRWAPFIETLIPPSGLAEDQFEQFLQSLRILTGPESDFAQLHRLSPDGARLAAKIALVLPTLIADRRDLDRWPRKLLLDELGWRDGFALRRSHEFPVGTYVQRNIATEEALQAAIRNAGSGYVALVGPPGSGKSTLLQTCILPDPKVVLARYLAFVPGEGQGVGRAEAADFLDDINAQLKRGGLTPVRFRDETLNESREQFGTLIKRAGVRFAREGIRTIIIVDGLDHIPREETPERSLLTEFPAPAAVPAGVLFVLGTQRLDLTGLKVAVREQAALPPRSITVAPLTRESVFRMANALSLDPDISRDTIFDICHGHPLVSHYFIEALRGGDAARREALLQGEFSFDGDIEAVYNSAWREIGTGSDADKVLGYIAHAEGPMPPELLAEAVSEHAVEQALRSAHHLLSLGPHGWTVFHNSFRLFILARPRLRFGKADPAYSAGMYRTLATLAVRSPADSPQRWLELRYRARAQDQHEVLALASAQRFRAQLADGRTAREIQADIRLAFAALRSLGSATDIFRLLLTRDEIDRRAMALGYAQGVVSAMLAVGDIDGAQAFAESHGKDGYEVVDALLQAGHVERARELFDRIEPLVQLLGGKAEDDVRELLNELHEWAGRVSYFRDGAQIGEAVDRLALLKPDWPEERHEGSYAQDLRLMIAQAVMTRRPTSELSAVATLLKVDSGDIPTLMVAACLSDAADRDPALQRRLIGELVSHPGFLTIANGQRRTIALRVADLGDLETARAIFATLEAPAVALLDGEIGDGMPRFVTRAVLEHAELGAWLGEQPGEVGASRSDVLRPLQVHANSIGMLLGQLKAGRIVAPGEVERAARSAILYLEHARPQGGGGQYYAMIQLSHAAPILVCAVVRAAELHSPTEFANVVSALDEGFTVTDSQNRRRIDVRRTVALEIYRSTGDSEQASARLEPLVSELHDGTPEEQIGELASLAETFVDVGNEARAREILRQLHDETLGYAVAPKKDPQYQMWNALLVSANAADPERRSERVRTMVRHLCGLMETAGSGAAYRIAADTLTEAALSDGGIGFTTARVMSDKGLLDWGGLLNALLLGIARRRPDLSGVCAVTWASLAMPFYSEPFYRSGRLGEIIPQVIGGASVADLAHLVALISRSLEADSQVTTRAPLLTLLAEGATAREAQTDKLDRALARSRAEAPPERDRGTPQKFDDAVSLDDLQAELDTLPPGSDPWETPYAFARLARTGDLSTAREMFERIPAIQADPNARFALFKRAIAVGNRDLARALIESYDPNADERSTWSYWSGARRLKYFKARVTLDGAAVHAEAYADLVNQLIAGQESATSLLADLDDVFPAITAVPDWPAMWDAVAENLGATREFKVAEGFAIDGETHSDDQAIVALYRWAWSLSLEELTRHCRDAALHLLSVENGGAVFVALVNALLSGDGDEPAEAMQLLATGAADSVAADLLDVVTTAVEHPDYAVAVAAMHVARRWGRDVSPKGARLPAFYDLVLDGGGDEFRVPTMVDASSGAMRVEDPLGWTAQLEMAITLLATNTVTVEQIRWRARMFIEQWGGVEAFGQPATDRRQAELARLDMRILFMKPHMLVAMRALRYVAGEMLRAGLLGRRDEALLLYEFGYPVQRQPIGKPVPRPIFLPRPEVDRTAWSEEAERWLAGVERELSPIESDGEIIVAEITRFEFRDIRRRFTALRQRGIALGTETRPGGDDGIPRFPRAIWAGGIIPLSDGPAPTLVRTVEESVRPELPRDMILICPRWLSRLHWRHKTDDWLTYLDGTGRDVAKIVWWRDGGQIDTREEVIWGEGVYLSVTAEGYAQLGSTFAGQTIQVHARRRTFDSDNSGQPGQRQRHAGYTIAAASAKR
ncbi:ATP-binding protein [Sphingomonas sp. RT2P30]|uniref:ATP-binding protein n=1 Tax=Parasphingomonas halimpatiens TaxID=3096162 RepID=UPI002FC61559